MRNSSCSPEEALVHALGGERGRQRHVAAGDALRQAEEVRRDVLVLAREHAAGAAEAHGHLVADEEDPVPVAQRAHVAQVALGVDDDARRALHQRLHDHRRDLVRVLRQQPLHVGRVARLGLQRVEQERPVHRVEEVDPAHRDGADGVPVVGVSQRHEAGAAAVGAALLLPVLERHLQRDLGGGGAAVRVEHAREARRGELHQPARELNGRRMREAQHRAVRHGVELIAHRGVDPGVAVTVDVAPQRRHAVDVSLPVGVDQVGALGALDDQRLLALPAPLLRERVPEVAAIVRGEAHGGQASSEGGRNAQMTATAAAASKSGRSPACPGR